jgi:hypothetical protein
VCSSCKGWGRAIAMPLWDGCLRSVAGAYTCLPCAEPWQNAAFSLMPHRIRVNGLNIGWTNTTGAWRHPHIT